MSGILDNRTRVIDAIMTQEGRRQLSRGDMRIEYYTYTDAGTYYRADAISGSADATTRIHLEASHLPQDQITFEADDSGRLNAFKNEKGIEVRDGQIISHSFAATSSSFITGAITNTTFLKGEQFASTADSLIKESLSNFRKLQIISSKDRIFEDDGFGVGTNNIEFVIHNERPISDPNLYVSHLDHLESLYNDPRLGNVPNFHYLPPINRVEDDRDITDHRAVASAQLGHYRPFGRTHLFQLGYEHIKYELGFFEEQGYCKTVAFDPTSRSNRLLIQVFEQGYNQLRKLDVIDYGVLRTEDPDAPLAHVFFVGKIFIDDNDTHTFVHLFTLIFE